MIQPIILAAGKGTRMNVELPKALFPIAGRPLIRRVIDSISEANHAKPPLIVVGYKAERIKEELGDEFQYVLQTEINGTAGAVKVCTPYLVDGDGVLILYADHPFLSVESIEVIEKKFKENPDALVLGIVQLPDFNEWRSPFLQFGRIIRNSSGELERIVEYKNATEEERAILEVNPGLYCVEAGWLKNALAQIALDPVKQEYLLTDIAAIADREHKRIVTIDLPPEEALGVNSLEDADRAAALLQSAKIL